MPKKDKTIKDHELELTKELNKSSNDMNNRSNDNYLIELGQNNPLKNVAIKQNYKLTEDQQEYILQASAGFTSLSLIAKTVNISVQGVIYYQKQYKKEIERIRKNYLQRLSNEPFSNKRIRIKALQDLYTKAIDLFYKTSNEFLQGRMIKQMESLLNTLRVETEGNKISFSGTMRHEYDDSSIIDKVRNAKNLLEIPVADVEK